MKQIIQFTSKEKMLIQEKKVKLLSSTCEKLPPGFFDELIRYAKLI